MRSFAVALALSQIAAPGLAAEPARRVLPETVGARIEAAIARAGPAWSLRDASIAATEVRGVLVLRVGVWATRDVPFVLQDPEPRCEAVRAGAWCVTLDAPLTDADRQPLLAALAADVPADVWRELPPVSRRDSQQRARDASDVSARFAVAAAAVGEETASGPILGALAALAALTLGLAWRWFRTPTAAAAPPPGRQARQPSR